MDSCSTPLSSYPAMLLQQQDDSLILISCHFTILYHTQFSRSNILPTISLCPISKHVCNLCQMKRIEHLQNINVSDALDFSLESMFLRFTQEIVTHMLVNKVLVSTDVDGWGFSYSSRHHCCFSPPLGNHILLSYHREIVYWKMIVHPAGRVSFCLACG